MSGPHAPSARGPSSRLVELDGARGEGGGQILRTALSLSLLTGRPFRITAIRANRETPGLRPQHLAAVEAAAKLGSAAVLGAAVGSRELTFRPGQVEPRDLVFDIGTAGATALVLHTLHLPLALKAEGPVRLVLTGGTFNDRAPSYPFLECTWRHHMAAIGLSVALAMPQAGFYPRGGGRLDVWIEPGRPEPRTLLERGPLLRVRGVAGVANLRFRDIAERMRGRATRGLNALGLTDEVEIALETADWPGRSPGAAVALIAEHEHLTATFVALGRPGKPAEAVADEALAAFAAYETTPGALDAHSADQVLLPLALAEGRSAYTVAEVTEHLRTNARTIRAFLDREIRIEESEGDRPGLVVVD